MSRFSCRVTLVLLALVSNATSVGAGTIVLVAGGGDKGDGAPGTESRLRHPFGVDFDKSGAMFIVELEGGHVHRVDSRGILSTIAGTGEVKGDAGDGGPAKKATFNGMHSLAIAPSGEIYVADTWNNRVRRIDQKSGMIAAFAGTGKKAYAGDDGLALKADCGGVYSVAFSPDAKTLYLADLDNRRIRAVDMQSGIIRLVAGNGERGVPADGAVAQAPLVDPRAVAADGEGNVYVLERAGHALRVVDQEGKIRTIAGTGQAGPAGDDQAAREATLRGPKHLCLDRDGNVIVADTDNHVIRKYFPREGRLVRIAGTGKTGDAGLDGPPEKVELNQPHGVHVDAAGTLFIVDSHNHRVLMIVK